MRVEMDKWFQAETEQQDTEAVKIFSTCGDSFLKNV